MKEEPFVARFLNEPSDPRHRMAAYRERLRPDGLRAVRIWVPDTRSAEFRATYRRQAQAIARAESEDDDLMRFVEDACEWPEP